jgi:hypothetical protein
MDEKSFQDFAGAVGSNVIDQTKQNLLVKERGRIFYVCWHVKETVDSVSRTKNRNQVLLDVKLLFGHLGRAKSGFCLRRGKRVIQKEP